MASSKLVWAVFVMSLGSLTSAACSDGGPGTGGSGAGGSTASSSSGGVGGCSAGADFNVCSCACGGVTVEISTCGPQCFALEGMPCGDGGVDPDGGALVYNQCVVISNDPCGCGA